MNVDAFSVPRALPVHLVSRRLQSRSPAKSQRICRHLVVACAGVICLFAAPISTHADDKGDNVNNQIERVLSQQAQAWNEGDIPTFMEHYWKSEKLTFSAGGKTTRGWAQTKENYLRRYPTRERMGTLSFDGLEVFPLGDAAALVLGRWHLKRKPDAIGGNFSLVFRRIDERWLIVHDHTSREEKSDAPKK